MRGLKTGATENKKRIIEENEKNAQIFRRFLEDAMLERESKEESQQEEEERMITQFVASDSSHKSSTARIPLDLVLNILARLPVGSAIRFRRVCKQWRSLTFEAHFLKQHFTISLERPHVILVPSKIWYFNHGRLPLYQFESSEEQGIKRYYPSIKLPGKKNYSLSHPVHGLVVLYDNFSIRPSYNYLLNPVTREAAKLPQGKIAAEELMYCQVALGFDASTGKYKMVRICQADQALYTCEILTIGSQEWRYVGELPCNLNPAPSSFLNGALYWVAVISLEPLHMGVLAFDIKEEKFRVIPMPHPVHFPVGSHRFRFKLCQHGGQIFFTEASIPPLKSCLKISVLKDGENPEWKQEYLIDMSRHPAQIRSDVIHIINIKGGKILFHHSPSIFSYDLQSEVLQEIYRHEGDGCLEPLYYMYESFISPESLLSDLPFP